MEYTLARDLDLLGIHVSHYITSILYAILSLTTMHGWKVAVLAS